MPLTDIDRLTAKQLLDGLRRVNGGHKLYQMAA